MCLEGRRNRDAFVCKWARTHTRPHNWQKAADGDQETHDGADRALTHRRPCHTSQFSLAVMSANVQLVSFLSEEFYFQAKDDLWRRCSLIIGVDVAFPLLWASDRWDSGCVSCFIFMGNLFPVNLAALITPNLFSERNKSEINSLKSTVIWVMPNTPWLWPRCAPWTHPWVSCPAIYAPTWK